MASLTRRAEEALLGALVQNPAQLDDVPYLRPDDLTDPRNQATFAALQRLHADRPGPYGENVAELVAARANTPGVDEPYLTRLTLSCPDTYAAAIYGRMVQEAAFRRTLATQAERLVQAAGTETGDPERRDHLLRLSAALEAHGRNFDNATDQLDTGASTMPAEATARQEELLLADLIQNSEMVREIREWLDPEVFSSAGRRGIYEAMVAVDEYGEPVTELTLSWELGRRTAIDYTLNGWDGAESRPEDRPNPGYLSHLGEMEVAAGSAAVIGRDLLTSHVRSELASEETRLTGQSHPAGLRASADNTFARQLSHDEPVLLKPPGSELGQDDRQLNMDQQ